MSAQSAGRAGGPSDVRLSCAAADPAAGLAGLFDAWHMTGRALAKASPAKKRRIAEQVRFLAEHQRRFYESTVRHLREELGYGGLISCSNWKTTDAHLLDGLERWASPPAGTGTTRGFERRFRPPFSLAGSSERWSGPFAGP